MKITTAYHALRRVGYMIALDVGAETASLILPSALVFATAILEYAGASEAVISGLGGVQIYLVWTFEALKMLAWSVILATLSWLNDVHPDFYRAHICYLLQILIYVFTSALAAVIDRVSFERGGSSMVSLLISPRGTLPPAAFPSTRRCLPCTTARFPSSSF